MAEVPDRKTGFRGSYTATDLVVQCNLGLDGGRVVIVGSTVAIKKLREKSALQISSANDARTDSAPDTRSPTVHAAPGGIEQAFHFGPPPRHIGPGLLAPPYEGQHRLPCLTVPAAKLQLPRLHGDTYSERLHLPKTAAASSPPGSCFQVPLATPSVLPQGPPESHAGLASLHQTSASSICTTLLL